MEFIQKNFVTVLVVGATVVLGGVAVFTAMRLYQLRDSGVTPAQPNLSSADEAPVGVRPSSGNWDLPEMFIVTNTSEEDVEVVWQLDCWDETVCEDTNGSEVLSPGQSLEEGMGAICSQWQLDLNYSGTANGEVWDWAGVSQISPDCDFDLEIDQATDSADVDDDEEGDQLVQNQVESPQPPVTTTSSDYEVTQCSVLSFSTGGGIGGAEETASPSATETAVATATPAITSTPAATATPAATDTPALPDAGIGLPTVLGMGIGAILLIAAMALAL